MELTIYPLGDTAFIERILNAVAMYTNTDGFSTTVATAALLGVFATAIQSIMKNGKEIDIASIFVGVGAYVILFGTIDVTVNMEDRTTGAFRQVDNVPAGVAIPTYLISNIGYNVTKGFSTIYSSVSTTNQNSLATGGTYADSLQALVDLRERSYTEKLYSAASQGMGGDSDFRRTLHNYIKECTLPKFDLGLATQSDLTMLPIEEAIRFESEIYHTEYHGPSGPEQLSCSVAYGRLSAVFSTFMGEPEVKKSLNKALRAESNLEWNNKLATTSSELLSDMGAGGLSAQQMALTMIVEPIMYEAAQGKYNDFQDQTLAIAMTNAIEQRNLSWAAQRSFFQETIYPMMTFFEGLSFAITPFVAFLMVMGAFGIKLGIKYFMLLIWIQLWMPLLSIVDLFITEGASSELVLAGSAGGASVNSIYFMNAAYDAAKTWIGTGSYMATSVPMISLFLVSGSMYGAASLASSISASTAKGADQAAEAVQPDAFNMGSLNSLQPASTTTSVGSEMSGKGDIMGDISFGDSASQSVQAARQNLEGSTNSFGEQMSDGLANATASGSGSSYLSAISQNARSSDSTTATASNQLTSQLQDSFDLTDQQTEQVSGAIALAASGSISMPEALDAISPIEGKLSGTGKATDQSGNTLTQAFKEGFGESEMASMSSQEQAAYTQDIAASISETGLESYSEEARGTTTSTLTDGAQEVKTAQDTHTAASGLASNDAFSGTMKLQDAAQRMDDDTFQNLRQTLDDNGVDYSQLTENYANATGDAEVAERGAVLRAAADSENPEISSEAFAAAANIYGLSTPEMDNVKAPDDLAAPETSNVKDNVPPRSNLDEVRTPEEVADAAGGLSTAPIQEDFLNQYRDVMDNGNVDQGDLSRAGNRLAQGAIGDMADNIPAIGGLTSAYELFAMPEQFANGAEPMYDGLMAQFGFGSDEGSEPPSLGERLASSVASGDSTGREQTAFAKAIDEAAQEGPGAIMEVADTWGVDSDAIDQALGGEMANFLASTGNQIGGESGEIIGGAGQAFEGGYEAGVAAYEESYDEMRGGIINDAQEKYGMTETQSALFADAAMGQMQDMFFNTTDEQSASREALIAEYAPSHGAEFANDLADVIEYASGNMDMAGSPLAPVQAFNETSNGSGRENYDDFYLDNMDKVNAAYGGAGTFTPASSPAGGGGSGPVELSEDQLEEMGNIIEESTHDAVNNLNGQKD